MDVTPVSAGEHVTVIERHIRHLKDGVRSMYQVLPFDKRRKLPSRIFIELVHAKTFYKNAVLALNRVSNTISPREIFTQQRINYDRHCCLMFVQYVKTHEGHDNTQKWRTIGAIAMCPTGTRQGGYLCFSLEKGRLIRRNYWTETIMPKEVIDRVHQLAQRNDLVGVEFADKNGRNLEVKSSDESSDVGTSVGSEEDGSKIGSAELEDSENGGVTDDQDRCEFEVVETKQDSRKYEEDCDGIKESAENPQTDEPRPRYDDSFDMGQNAHPHTPEEQDMEERYGPRTTAYNLRTRRVP